MIPPSKIGRTAPVVLHLTGAEVEALVARRGSARAEAGSPGAAMRLIRFDCDEPIGQSLAGTIVERLRAHGVHQRSAIVALGPNVVASQVLELPPLVGRNLELVIGRRAAGLVGLAPEQTAYSALALDGEDADPRRWLLQACDRRLLKAFQTEMRKLGVTVQTVVPARTAPFLSGWCAEASLGDEATLVALFEPTECAIGLLSGGRLVQLSVLPAGAHAYLTDPQTARSFVQELRGIDAFWRRRSRGERVGRVVIGGVEGLVVRDLKVAIRAALGEVEVTALDPSARPVVQPVPGEIPVAGLGALDLPPGGDYVSALDDAAEEARMAVLASLHSTRLAPVDLAVELRPRNTTLALAAGASFLVWGALAAGVRADLATDAYVVDVGAKLAQTAAADFEELTQLEAEATGVEAELRSTIDELRRASAMGVEFETLVRGVETAFDGHGVLLSATAVAGSVAQGQSGALRIRGGVLDTPGEAAAALDVLRTRLAGIRGVTDVRLDLPSLERTRPNGTSVEAPLLRFSAVLGLSAPELEPVSADAVDGLLLEGGAG